MARGSPEKAIQVCPVSIMKKGEKNSGEKELGK